MIPRRALVFLALFASASTSLHAQTHLTVDLSDRVYDIIEAGEIRGALGRLSQVRPYSRSEIVNLLERMWEQRHLFSVTERDVLKGALERFRGSREGLRNGNVAWREEERRLRVGADFQGNTRLNVQEPKDWHLDSVLRPYLLGDLGPNFSFLGALGLTIDRVRADATFVPYEFSKQWDTFHIFFGEPRYSYDGALDHPTFSFLLETDIAARVLQDSTTIRVARHRREWGVGDGSLTLSGTARPFVGVEAQFRILDWLGLSHVVGSLGDWMREPGAQAAGSITYQKLYALQKLELFPLSWLYISASSSVVGAKRFELGYMVPLLFAQLYQVTMGDLDNVGVCVEMAATWAPFGKFYFSFYADELETINPSELFHRPRNMFALQGGVRTNVPWVPFAEFTFQYTRIEPFTYAHYVSHNPDYRVLVETSYTHDGENLAYYLHPNSDEFLIKLQAVPYPFLRAAITYKLVRHGDNPSSNPGDPAILGRPEAYLDYSVALDSYPDKHFLRDGLYDYNNIVTLSADYSIPNSPVTVGVSYSFSHTSWFPNDSGEPDRPDRVRNILGFTVSVFR